MQVDEFQTYDDDLLKLKAELPFPRSSNPGHRRPVFRERGKPTPELRYRCRTTIGESLAHAG
jgi:hypothetical protein